MTLAFSTVSRSATPLVVNSSAKVAGLLHSSLKVASLLPCGGAAIVELLTRSVFATVSTSLLLEVDRFDVGLAVLGSDSKTDSLE